jgi:hypothetical protein
MDFNRILSPEVENTIQKSIGKEQSCYADLPGSPASLAITAIFAVTVAIQKKLGILQA